MFVVDYSLAWKLETMCPAITYFYDYVSIPLSTEAMFDVSKKRNTRCDDAISINHSINLVIDYFNNRLISYNRFIVAALTTIKYNRYSTTVMYFRCIKVIMCKKL